jgi:2'-5' RNA ligase
MRLFTAIDLPEAARSAIAAERAHLISRAGERAAGLRLVPVDHLHITLVFIGEMAEARGTAIIGAMADPLRMAPFELTLAGLGVFPTRGVPRALWIGVRRGRDDAAALHSLVAVRLRPYGISEPRAFRPHLTIGRWGTSRVSGRSAIRGLDALAVHRAIATMTVEAVTLFESRLSSSGSTYTALVRTPLTCA